MGGWVDPDHCVGVDADCNASCQAGACLWPDDTALCGSGVCYACDGAGNCNQLPSGSDDPACAVSCTGVWLYQQAGDPNGWDGFTWCRRAPASGTGGRCQAIGTCKTPAEWCTTAGTYSNHELATLCEMFQTGTCAGQVAPNVLPASSAGTSCNGNPPATCEDHSGDILCEINEPPRPIWPESGSHVWAHGGGTLLQNQKFVFESPLEDLGMFTLTAGPTYSIELSATRGFAAIAHTIPSGSCEVATSGDFIDYVVCTNDGFTPTGTVLYWRAVTAYGYEGGAATVTQTSTVWPLRLGPPNDVDGDGYSDLLIGTAINPRLFWGSSSLSGTVSETTGLEFIESATGPDNFNTSIVHHIGDVTGDGYQDILLTSGANPDVAYVVKGRARAGWSSPMYMDTERAASRAFLITPSHTGSEYEFANSATGLDLNGDGVGDLVVSSRLAGDEWIGHVYVFFGPIDADLTGSPAGADVTLTGVNASDYLGDLVARAGDIDGDGFDDLLVTDAAIGVIYVIRGGSTFPTTGTWQVPAIDNLSVTVWTPSYSTPAAVAAGLDVDLDGYPDLFIGARAYNVPSSNAGSSMVVYTPDPDATDRDLEITSSAASDWEHLQLTNGTSCSSCWLGCSVGWGRYDDNMSVDIYSGAMGTSSSTGAVYLEFAIGTSSKVSPIYMTAAADIYMNGEILSDQLGKTGATVGDLDRDGRVDLVFGAQFYDDSPSNTGRVYVVLSSDLPSTPPTHDLWTTANISMIVEGSVANRQLGGSIGRMP
jgi:hypothetical protein